MDISESFLHRPPQLTSLSEMVNSLQRPQLQVTGIEEEYVECQSPMAGSEEVSAW